MLTKNNRKSQFVNILTLFIALSFIVFGLYSIMSDGQLTGFAPKVKHKDRIYESMLSKLDRGEEVEVIVILKDDKTIKDKPLELRKQHIKNKQDKVLKKLNYSEFKQKTKEKKEFILENKYNSINSFSGKITKDAYEKLKDDPNVEKIIPARRLSISLAQSVPLINADDIWNISINNKNINGSGQSVCVIDTGVDYTHESLGGCTLQNFTEHNCKVIAGYDFVDDDADPMDTNGHGTHVAGIVAGNGEIIGVAPDANIVAMRPLDGSGSGSEADVIAAIDWCVTNSNQYNISVISMSLGDGGLYTEQDCPTSMDSAIIAANQAGISVIVSTGNNGSTAGISYPSCSPYVTSVSSTTKSDTVSYFSNVNYLADVYAPGSSILSSINGGGLAYMSGTSMAAPHASGVAALIYQYEKELNNKQASPTEVESLLKRSHVVINYADLIIPRIDALDSVSSIAYLNYSDNSASLNNITVKFNTATDLNNFTEAFIIGNNFVYLNSSKYPQYNKSAIITFRNLPYAKQPVVLRDGKFCSDCSILDYSDRTLVFSVPHFTNYSSSANSNLVIFDSGDPEGGSNSLRVNQQIYFFANYTNASSGEAILTGVCNINFTDMFGEMAYNSTSKLFEFNRTFSLSAIYNYSINCSEPNYESLNSSDDLYVQSGCLDQTPNQNITISSNEDIFCQNEDILLINQSLFIYGNLTLNNSNLSIDLQGTSDDDLYLYNLSNLNILNSRIFAQTEQGGVSFTVFSHNGSIINIFNSNLTNIYFQIRGNTSFVFNNSYFSTDFDAKENSRGNISNSHFNRALPAASFEATDNSSVSFLNVNMNITFLADRNSTLLFNNSNLSTVALSSYGLVTFSNTTINNISTVGSSQGVTLNFTKPTSIINIITQFLMTSNIFGYVDMPSTYGSAIASTIRRYYPVEVYELGVPLSNEIVNLTNSSGDVLMSVSTDSTGIAWVNVTYTSSPNTLNNKYNVSVRTSVQEIGLLSDTPVIFNFTNNPPNITWILLNSTYGTNLTTENLTVYWSAEDEDNDSIINITDWRINGISIAVLNMPFEGGSNSTFTKDYSTYGNNGTVTGATWSSTAGYNRFGAYYFDGTDDYIEVPYTASLDIKDSISICSWIYLELDGEYLGIVNRDYTASYYFGTAQAGQKRLSFYYGGTEGKSTAGSLTLNNWTHVCVSYDRNEKNLSFYINGVLDTIITSFNPTVPGNIGRTLRIGSQHGGYFFKGKIDNLLIFNRSLSAEQIKALYNNRTDLIVSQETKVGDVWSVAVTPNDRIEDGMTVLSNNVTILELTDTSAPIISNVLNYSITNESAIINWTTDDISNSTVTANGIVFSLNDAVTEHSVLLTGLTNATLYSYNVTSCNIYGNCTTSSQYEFTTLQNVLSCIDNDGDGFNSTDGCGIIDCDDNNASIKPPADNLVINESVVFCSGTYNITSRMNITKHNVSITCLNTVMRGNIINTILHSEYINGTSVINCTFENASLAINFIEGNGNQFINNNIKNTDYGIMSGGSETYYYGNNLSNIVYYAIHGTGEARNTVAANNMIIGFGSNAINLGASLGNNITVIGNTLMNGGHGISVGQTYGDNIHVKNNYMFNLSGYGISSCGNPKENLTIINNTILLKSANYGIYTSCGGINYGIIENNTIINSTSAAIMYSGTSASEQHHSIKNNIINCSSGGGFFSPTYIINNATFSNNVIINCNYAIDLNGNASTFFNNTIINSTSVGIQLNGNGHNVFIGNKILANGGSGIVDNSNSENDVLISNIIQNVSDRAIGLHGNYGFNITVINNTIYNSQNGIYVSSNSNFSRFANNTLVNISYIGIYLCSYGNNFISNNYITGHGMYGLLLPCDNSFNSIITNNKVINFSDTAIGLFTYSYNSTIANNFIENTQRGIYLSNYADYSVFVNNTILNTSDYAIYACGNGNNVFIKNNISKAYKGIAALCNFEHNDAFIDNIITDTTSEAIYIGGGPADNLTVKNNILINSKSTAIYLTSGGGNDYIVDNNTIINVTSGYGIYACGSMRKNITVSNSFLNNVYRGFNFACGGTVNSTIENNTIVGSINNAIEHGGANQISDWAIIKNNNITCFSGDGYVEYANKIYNAIFSDNTFTSCNRSIYSYAGGLSNSLIYSNKFLNNNLRAISFESFGDNSNIIYNNTFVDNAFDIYSREDPRVNNTLIIYNEGNMLKFDNTYINVSDIDNLYVANRIAAVNSSAEPIMNKTAEIVLVNLNWPTTPTIYRYDGFTKNPDFVVNNGIVCNETNYCKDITYSSGILKFNVTEFSSYAVGSYTPPTQYVPPKEEEEEIVERQSPFAPCQGNWSCTEWGYCINGKQKRTCKDLMRCYKDKEEIQSCEVKEEPPVQAPIEEKPAFVEKPKSGFVWPKINLPKISLPKISLPKITLPTITVPSFIYYMFAVIVLSLLILPALAKRKEEREILPEMIKLDYEYIEQERISNATKLYDHIINLFKSSKKLERKYGDQIESLAVDLDGVSRFIQRKKLKTVERPKTEIDELNNLIKKTNNLLNKNEKELARATYNETFKKFISLDYKERKLFEEKIKRLRDKILEL